MGLQDEKEGRYTTSSFHPPGHGLASMPSERPALLLGCSPGARGDRPPTPTPLAVSRAHAIIYERPRRSCTISSESVKSWTWIPPIRFHVETSVEKTDKYAARSTLYDYINTFHASRGPRARWGRACTYSLMRSAAPPGHAHHGAQTSSVYMRWSRLGVLKKRAVGSQRLSCSHLGCLRTRACVGMP